MFVRMDRAGGITKPMLDWQASFLPHGGEYAGAINDVALMLETTRRDSGRRMVVRTRNPAVVLIRDLYKGETPIADGPSGSRSASVTSSGSFQGDMRREAGGEIVDTVGDYIRSFFAQVAIEATITPIPVDDERMPAVSPFDFNGRADSV